MPNIIELFEFVAPKNEYETEVVGHYLDREVGEMATKKAGWYGSPGRCSGVERAVEVEIDGENFLFLLKDAVIVGDVNEEVQEAVRRMKRKEKLLASMSDEDKEILGLMEEK